MSEVALPPSASDASEAAGSAGGSGGSADVECSLLRLATAAPDWPAEPHWRLAFNIGPAYQFEGGTEGGQRTQACRRHALVVVPPGQAVRHKPVGPAASDPAKGPELAVLRIPTALFAQAAMGLGLQYREARLDYQVIGSDELLRLHAQALLLDLREGRPDGAVATERTAGALVTRLLVRNAARRPPVAMGAIDRVQAYINANLASELALERLAAIAGMSLFHFCRVFRDHVGVTPHQYIVARRLDHAKSLLWANRGSADDALSVLEVARACGFNSPSHFAAQFKRHTGKTPMQWQREG